MLQPSAHNASKGDEGVARPDISVVIVSWNVRHDLMRCLSSLLSPEVSGSLSVEVIIIDNASTDGTVDALRGCPVRVVANASNVGFGAANNVGLGAARGRHLMVLNPDTIPQPGSMEALVAFSGDNARAGIVAPRLLNPDGTVQPSAFTFPTLAMAAIDLFTLPAIIPGRFRSRLGRSALNGRYTGEDTRSAPFRIDHPLGACFLLKREAFEQCGGFDERFFMYSEEIDLALRYSRVGWRCWQVPSAQVVHLGGQSTRQMPVRMFAELWRSRLYLYSKHYSLSTQLLLKLMLRIAMYRDLAATGMRHRLRLARREDQVRRRRARAVLRMLARL